MIMQKFTKVRARVTCWKLQILIRVTKVDLGKIEKYTMIMGWKINIVKTSILPKLIYSFNIISIKNQQAFKTINKLILTFMWKRKVTRIVKTIWEKKKKFGELTLPDFKTRSEATVIKRMWYQLKQQLAGVSLKS